MEARTDRILAKAARAGEPDASMEATGLFFFERAEKEHEAAERKREAALTKATAIAALAAALAAIVAAPALDASGLAQGTRWLLLLAATSFLASVGCVAGAILIHVRPGERVDRDELENWLTEDFWVTDVVIHAFDLTQGFVEATVGLREANDAAEKWISRATAAIAGGLVMLLLAFFVEIV